MTGAPPTNPKREIPLCAQKPSDIIIIYPLTPSTLSRFEFRKELIGSPSHGRNPRNRMPNTKKDDQVASEFAWPSHDVSIHVFPVSVIPKNNRAIASRSWAAVHLIVLADHLCQNIRASIVHSKDSNKWTPWRYFRRLCMHKQLGPLLVRFGRWC